MSVNGLVTSVAWVPQGSELTAAAIIGATTLYVESTVDFDDAGGDLEINGDRYEYDSCDEDADTITLTTPLTAAVAEDDRVLVVSGGQTAIEYVAFVTMGEGDDAEVAIPYEQRDKWPEGAYDEPVPVVLSNDLEMILSVPGRTPIVDGSFLDPDTVTAGRVIVGDEAGVHLDITDGKVETWSGLTDETPGFIDPIDYGGRGALWLATSTANPHNDRSELLLVSGTAVSTPPLATLLTGVFDAYATSNILLHADNLIDISAGTTLDIAADTVTVAADSVYFSSGPVTVDALFTLGATMGAGSVGTGTFRDSVDARVTNRTQTGLVASATIPADPVNWTNLGTFAFPTAFTAAPNVIVQSQTSYGADWIAFRTTATTTNFTLYGKSPTAKGAQTVAWIAVSNG